MSTNSTRRLPLKITEAAQYLGVSPDTLRRWELTGKITPIRTPGGTRLYPIKELNRIKEENNNRTLTISEAAAMLGVSTKTLRRWDHDGKFVAERNSQGERVYSLTSLKPLLGSGLISNLEQEKSDDQQIEQATTVQPEHAPKAPAAPVTPTQPQISQPVVVLTPPVIEKIELPILETAQPSAEPIIEYQAAEVTPAQTPVYDDPFRGFIRSVDPVKETLPSFGYHRANNLPDNQVVEEFQTTIPNSLPKKKGLLSRGKEKLNANLFPIQISVAVIVVLLLIATTSLSASYFFFPAQSKSLATNPLLQAFNGLASTPVKIFAPKTAAELGFTSPENLALRDELNRALDSQVLGLTALRPGVLEVNSDATIIGDLTAPNIIYQVIAGQNVTITAGQRPTISVVGFLTQEVDTLASVTGRGATTTTPTIFNGGITATSLNLSGPLTLNNVLNLGQLADDPGSAIDGATYYNTSENKFRCYENGTWKDCDTNTGGAADGVGIDVVKEGDVAVVTGATSLDFLAGDFDVTEAPTGEANVSLSPTLTSVVGVAGSFNVAGSLTIGGVDLAAAGTNNTNSGATLIGVFPELSNSTATTLQEVLNDLDAAVGGGGSKWTQQTGFIYLTSITDDVVIGGTDQTTNTFFFDNSASNLRLGDGSTTGTIQVGILDLAADTVTDITGNGLQVSGGALGVRLLSVGTDAASATTASPSGLEFISGQLSMLQGCSDGEILKWTESTDTWACGSDSGATSAVINVKEGNGANVGTGVDTLNFSSTADTDFDVTNSGSTDTVNIDYTNFGSRATPFNIGDALGGSSAGAAKRIDIGGVDTDLASTINISTNSTTADVITIGNNNAATTLALTGGTAWSISTAGAASLNSLSLVTALSVPNGGTGAQTLTSNGVLYGNGVSAIAATTAGTNGQLLLGVTGSAPAFGTMSQDATITNAGVLTIATGAVTTGKILDNTITATDIAATLTFADGDYLDLSAIVHDDTALQGLRLPNTNATPSNPTSGEGQIAYDTVTDVVKYYNGAAWVTLQGTSGVGDITAVGSMTSGDTFADATADDDWLGLGASAGRIEFDDQTTDEINFLAANIGINTSTPTSRFQVNAGTVSGSDTRYIDLSNDTNSRRVGLGILADGNVGVLSSDRLFLSSTVGSGGVQVKLPLSTSSFSDVASTQQRLSVGGSGSVLWLGSASASQVVRLDTAVALDTNDGRFTLTSGGNVGIGDSSPSSRLEVGDGTDSLQVSSVGDLTFVDADGGASITGPAGGALGISAGSTALNLQSDGSIDVNLAGGSGATGCTVTNSTGAFACSGAVTGSNLSGSNTGDQTITLTTDVTGSGTGTIATTIATGAVTTGKILDNTITTTDIAATLTFADGDYLDLSAIVHDDTALQGLRLPNTNATPSNPTSGEGQIAYDTVTDVVKYYDGAAWVTLQGTAGVGDITAVTAGDGLTGGGTSGAVTLDIGGSATITVAADAISVTADSIGDSQLAFNTGQHLTTTSSVTFDTLTLTNDLSVANGGTGASTFTSHGVLYGNGASAIGATAAGTDGQLLLGVTSAAPAFATMSQDATITNAGVLTIANGVVNSAKITDNTITPTDLAATLTFADADYIDLSAILHDDTALQGLRLPNTSATPSNPTSGEGQIAYDAINNSLIYYDGSAWQTVTNTGTAGDITAVTAGNGLTGGGTSGAVTLDIGSSATITVNANDIAVTADSIGDTQLAFNTGQDLTTSSAVTFATVDTGQGANELYDMNQNVMTTSSVTFDTLTLTNDLSVANGGTGASTFTSNGVLYGNGASAIGATTAGTNGQLLLGVTGSAPAFASMSSDATITNAGVLTIATGAVTTGKILDDTITATDIAATLTFADGDYLDLSAIVHDDTALQGLRLPNTSSTPSNPTSGEGQIAYDATANRILYYDGSAWIAVSSGAGASKWTDAGAITYLTATTDDLAVGGTGATSPLFLDVSASALSLNPFGTSTGNTGEIRFTELAAGGTNYTGFKAPDALSTDVIYTLPNAAAGGADQVLTWQSGNVLQWKSISGAGGGTGSVTSIAAGVGIAATPDPITTTGTIAFDFSAALSGNHTLAANEAKFGQSGIIFEGSSADNVEGYLAVANPTSADKTWTFPDLTGTVALLENSQTFSGLKTFSAGLTVTAGQTLTVNSEGFTDLTGNGLFVSSNTLAINLFTPAADGASSTVSSPSGLEFVSGQLSMLQGCDDLEILKWDETADEWVCSSDSGATSAVVNIQEGGSPVGTGVDTINFDANDFSVSNSTNTDTIVIDYTNFGTRTSPLNIGDGTGSRTIDIGGVTNSGTDTINIATNSTAADTIAIGNSNASTTFALTGGDDWSISTAGAGVLATLDTGQGANELYDMDQNVLTTSSVTFDTLTLTNDLSVANGGTGASTFTSNGVLYGNGASAIGATTAGTNGQLLLGVTGSAPAFASMSSDATITNAGVLTIATGAVTTGKILDNTITTADIAATLTFADADYIDLSAILHDDTALQGLRLPNTSATPSNPTSGEGQIAYDATSNLIEYYDGSAWQTLTPSASAGDITAVTAGDGLTGGGTSGAVTLDIGGSSTITVAADAISVTADSIGDTQLAFNTGQHLTTTSAVTFATVDTGQGANELFDMDQNVLTTSSVTFDTLTLTNDLSVANGGTGASTFTSNGVLYGNGASAIGVTTAGTNGQLLLGVTGSAPAFASMSSDATITNAGVLTIATGAVTSGKILDNTITATDIAATLTFADGDYLDLSAILHDDTALQGLRLPNTNATPSNPTSGEGQIAYDTVGDVVKYYNGSAWVTLQGTAGVGDITAVGNVLSGSAFTGADSSSDKGNSLIFEGDASTNDANDLTLTAAAITGSSKTITMPNLTGTLALLENAQTFTGAKTFDDLIIADTDVALTGASSTFTSTGAFTLTPGGAVTLGDGGDTMAINTSDWDINATGDATGIGSLTMDGVFTQTYTSTSTAHTITANSVAANNVLSVSGTGLTTGKLASLTATNTAVTDAAINPISISLTNAQGTTANTTSYTGLNLSYAHTPTVATATETVGLISLAANAGSPADTTVASLLRLENLDTATGNSITVADGLLIQATTASLITDAIDVSDAEIDNALNIGANTITGTTGVIDLTNFDVSSAGNITVAAAQGLDTNAAGALNLGATNATSAVIGSSALTSLTVTTDGTGNGEVVLPTGSISSGEILDDTITTSDLNATLTFADGDYIDLSAILHDDTALQGLRLPNTNATPSNPTSGEGFIAYDAVGNVVKYYDGAAWVTLQGTAGVGDITAVTAGDGLTGGGTSGAVTLDIGGSATITVAADAISVTADSIGDTQLAFNTGQHLTTTSAVTFATVDTGQGANELFDMDQNVLTTSSVTFDTLTLTNDLSVANGGTGASTFTSNGVLYGNGASAIGVTAAGTNGQLLLGVTGSAPAFASMSTDATITNAGVLTIATGAVTSGKILDNTITATDIAATLTFADGDFLDLAAIIHDDSALQGFRLPQNTALTNLVSGEGFLAWDSDDNQVKVYDGSAWSNISGASTTLQDAYNNDADGSNSIIALAAADDSLIFRNPASSGTDSSFLLTLDQLATGAVDTLVLNNAGTGAVINATSANTSGTKTNGFLIDQSGAGTMTNALNITNSAGTLTNGITIGSGTQAITTAINLASTGITTDLSLQNGETIDNNTNNQINLGLGASGTLLLTSSTTSTIANSAGALAINATATGLNLQADGSVDVNIAGGSGATGCTVTNTSGDLSCSGTITSNGSVLANYWQRNSTTLSPATSGDNISIVGATTDITTGTNEALTLSPNGSGDLVFALDADTNAQFTASAAPGVDMIAITNSGQATATNGVDGIAMTLVQAADGSNLTDITNAGINMILTGSGEGGDTLRGLNLTSTTTNAGVTESIRISSLAASSGNFTYGMNIANLASAGAGTEYAINVGTGWDRGLSLGSPEYITNAAVTGAGGRSLNIADTGVDAGRSIDVAVNSLTSGRGISISSTSTAATTNYLGYFDSSGAANSATRYGVYSTMTGTGTTSTNVAGYFSATGATSNYAGVFENGNVGIGDTTPTSLLTVGASDAFQVNSSGNIVNIGAAAHSITNTAGALGIDSATTGAINIGTSNNAKTITVGNATGATALAFNSGTGSQTFTSQVTTGTTTTSGFVMDATAINTGTGLYLTSDSITTGKLAQVATTGNTLTSGTLLDLRTTATSLTGAAGTGSLVNLDWSPGSTTAATGDLFALNIGANGSTSGKLFNILDSASSIFSISETQLTSSLPANFTAPGDIAVAYDINFTNPTSSFIKSAAPLTLQSGETFNSSDLTLGTYNSGRVVLSNSAYANCEGLSVSATGTMTCGQIMVRKAATETVTSSAALQDDDELVFAMGTNETWIFQVNYTYSTGASATPDIRVGFNAPSGAVCTYGVADIADAGQTVNAGSTSCDGTVIIATTLTGTRGGILTGSVTTGSTSGNGIFRWGQGTSNGTATSLLLGSSMTAYRVFGADYAEVYYSKDASLQPGTIVSVDGSLKSGVQKAAKAYDQGAMGIISAQIGQLVGDAGDGKGSPVFVALAGRVNTKVSDENGPIKAGDYLTSSSIPGVAMKATRPGQTIGKALDDYNGSGLGKINVFVNVAYADPNAALANISIDKDGSLTMPSLKIGAITIDEKGLKDLTVNSNSLALDMTNIDQLIRNTQNQVQTLASKVNSLQNKVDQHQTELEHQDLAIASQSAQLATLNTQVEGVSSTSASLAAQIASASAQLAQVQSRVDDMHLTPPDVMIATESANFANLKVEQDATFSQQLTAYDLAVANNFKSYGQSLLGDTTIAGTLLVDGTFSIADNSINVIGTPVTGNEQPTDGILYVQNSPLANLVDFFNGSVTIDKQGVLRTKEIVADQIKINTGKSAGTGIITAGATTVTINNLLVKDNSVIIITPETTTSKVLAVSQKQANQSFTVTIAGSQSNDLKFNYLIIGQE